MKNMKNTSGEPRNIDSLCGAGRALLAAGFVGGLVGMLTGACIGLPFFVIGALYGAAAGIPTGFVAGLFGAAIGGRSGWTVSGAIAGLLGGAVLGSLFCAGYRLDNGFFWFLCLLPTTGGWFVGRSVGKRVCGDEATETGLLGWVGRCLYRSALYQLPIVFRLLIALFELIAVCLTVNVLFHR